MGIRLSSKKCAAMRFSQETGPDQSQNYYLNNQLIKFTTSQSDLGILVVPKWSLHINNFASKANQMLGFIRRNCFHIVFYYKCMTGLYNLDIDRYIKRPLHQSTRSSSGDFLRPNLCRTALFRNSFFNRIVYYFMESTT